MVPVWSRGDLKGYSVLEGYVVNLKSTYYMVVRPTPERYPVESATAV